jgi:hypothetical protein
MMAGIKDVAAAVLPMTKEPLHEALDGVQMETWSPHPTEVLLENVTFTSSSDMMRAIERLMNVYKTFLAMPEHPVNKSKIPQCQLDVQFKIK